MAIRRFDGPQKISDSLNSLIKRFSRTDLVGIAALENGWSELVGEQVAAHTKPSALRGTTLVVTVDQPAWATQFRMSAGNLLEVLSAAAGQRIESFDCKVAR